MRLCVNWTSIERKAADWWMRDLVWSINIFQSRGCVLRDCVSIADNTYVAPDTVIPPFAIFAGNIGKSAFPTPSRRWKNLQCRGWKTTEGFVGVRFCRLSMGKSSNVSQVPRIRGNGRICLIPCFSHSSCTVSLHGARPLHWITALVFTLCKVFVYEQSSDKIFIRPIVRSVTKV